MLVFQLDELQCAIESAAVVEILRAAAIAPMPGQAPFVAGVLDIRGVVTPVLDLRVRFGRETRALALSDVFVVVRVRSQTIALWTDGVVDLFPFETPVFAPRDGFLAGTKSLAGVARLDDRLVMIHDIEAFLTQSEADALALLGRV